MIQIEDNDLPITVAEKIITGTKPYNPPEFVKSFVTTNTQDMFDLEEIKEIADYLMTYYNSHPTGD